MPDVEAATAVKVALAALVEMYRSFAQQEIDRFQPWTAEAVGATWEVRGTMPKHMIGGTFVVVVDRRHARIIDIFHEQ